MKTPEFFAIALAAAVLGVADGALAEQAKKLFFEGDLVRHTIENQKGPFCVLTSQFKRKEAVAWRIRVLVLPMRHRRHRASAVTVSGVPVGPWSGATIRRPT